MSLMTLNTVRSRTNTARPARTRLYLSERWPRGRTSRRIAFAAAVHSITSSQMNNTSVRVML